MKRFRSQSDSGQILPMTALLLLPLLFISAFAIDVGSFYLRASELQTVSDIAALSGAEALGNGSSESEVRALVEGYLIENGFDLSDIDLVVTISGSEVSVSVTDPSVPQYFSQLMVDGIDVQRDSTATTGNCFGCETDIVVGSESITFPRVGNGDGFKVLPVQVGSDLRFYALNHHRVSHQGVDWWGGVNGYGETIRKSSQLVCVSVELQDVCPGYTATAFDTATALESTLAYTEGTQELWYLALRPQYSGPADSQGLPSGRSTPWGFGCIQLDGTVCPGMNNGMHVVDTEDRIVWRYSPTNGQRNDIGQYSSSPVAYGDKVYMIDYDMQVHCYDASANSPCWSSPQSHSAYSSLTNSTWIESSGTNWLDERNSVPQLIQGSKAYFGFALNNGSASVVCYDMATESPCSGWGQWTIPSMGGLVWLFSDYSAATGEDGVCVTGLQWISGREAHRGLHCRTSTGSARSRPDLLTAINNLLEYSSGNYFTYEGNPLRAGSRLFMGRFSWTAGEKSTFCIDTETLADCGERRDDPSFDTEHQPYSYTKVPNQDCYVAHGHRQRFDFFDSNMNSCVPGGTNQRIYPCDCGGGDFRWGSLDFDMNFDANFTQFDVTLLTPSGDILVDAVDLTVEGNRVTIPPAADGLPYLELVIDATARPGFDYSSNDFGKVVLSERAVLVD